VAAACGLMFMYVYGKFNVSLRRWRRSVFTVFTFRTIFSLFLLLFICARVFFKFFTTFPAANAFRAYSVVCDAIYAAYNDVVILSSRRPVAALKPDRVFFLPVVSPSAALGVFLALSPRGIAATASHKI